MHLDRLVQHGETLEVIVDALLQLRRFRFWAGLPKQAALGLGLVVEGAGDLGEQRGDAAVIGKFPGEGAGFFHERIAVLAGHDIDALHENGDARKVDVRAAILHRGIGVQSVENRVGLAALGGVLLEIATGGQQMREPQLGVRRVGILRVTRNEGLQRRLLLAHEIQCRSLGFLAVFPLRGRGAGVHCLDLAPVRRGIGQG